MSNEKITYNFLADVRKKGTEHINDWEESANDDHDAELMFDAFEKRLKNLGRELKHSKVLEIGSGNNIFLSYLQKQGVDVVGTDVRPRGEIDGLPVTVARIERLPFPDETFDVVLSRFVFDTNVYNQNHRLMMEEISRVLKHGGIYASIGDYIEKSIDSLTPIPNTDHFKVVSVFSKS